MYLVRTALLSTVGTLWTADDEPLGEGMQVNEHLLAEAVHGWARRVNPEWYRELEHPVARRLYQIADALAAADAALGREYQLIRTTVALLRAACGLGGEAEPAFRRHLPGWLEELEQATIFFDWRIGEDDTVLLALALALDDESENYVFAVVLRQTRILLAENIPRPAIAAAPPTANGSYSSCAFVTRRGSTAERIRRSVRRVSATKVTWASGVFGAES